MFLPGQCYQFIHISCCGMHAFRSQGIHDSSHFVYRDAAHGCRISFQQDIEQAYCRVKFEVFPFLRQSETMENHFRFGRQGIIGLVAQFQLGFFRRREPVTLSLVQFCFQLGEKLFVLQWRAVYLLLYLGKEITAASATETAIAEKSDADEKTGFPQVAPLVLQPSAPDGLVHRHQ